jgi:hypothetical protein
MIWLSFWVKHISRATSAQIVSARYKKREMENMHTPHPPPRDHFKQPFRFFIASHTGRWLCAGSKKRETDQDKCIWRMFYFTICEGGALKHFGALQRDAK